MYVDRVTPLRFTGKRCYSLSKLSSCLLWQGVSLKHDGTDGTAYRDGTAGLVADGTAYTDGTAVQLLVEQTELPIQTGQLCRCVTVSHLYLSLTKHSVVLAP